MTNFISQLSNGQVSKHNHFSFYINMKHTRTTRFLFAKENFEFDQKKKLYDV